MGRSILCIELPETVRCPACSVATVHLESPEDKSSNRLVRERQMCFLLQKLPSIAKSENMVLLGDFNAIDETEDQFVHDPFIDVWSLLRNGDPGYTYDAQV